MHRPRPSPFGRSCAALLAMLALLGWLAMPTLSAAAAQGAGMARPDCAEHGPAKQAGSAAQVACCVAHCLAGAPPDDAPGARPAPFAILSWLGPDVAREGVAPAIPTPPPKG